LTIGAPARRLAGCRLRPNIHKIEEPFARWAGGSLRCALMSKGVMPRDFDVYANVKIG
jgi:hypothetical protein